MPGVRSDGNPFAQRSDMPLQLAQDDLTEAHNQLVGQAMPVLVADPDTGQANLRITVSPFPIPAVSKAVT